MLEGRHVQGLRTIDAHRKNLDLLTVCILPTVPLEEENIILIPAIISQVEMLFLLHRAGCKKIRTQDQWEQIESCVTKNSLARFSHPCVRSAGKNCIRSYFHPAEPPDRQKNG